MKKKILSLGLALATVLNAVPVTTAFAEEKSYDLPFGGLEAPVAIPLTEEEIAEISEQVKDDYAECTTVSTRKEAVYDFTTDYYYNQLDSEEKALYNALKEECEAFMASDVNLTDYYLCDGIYFSSNITNDELNQIYSAFYYSNPQYYFLRNGYGYFTSGGYVNPVIIDETDVSFRLNSTRDQYEKTINSVTNSWMAEINACSTDLEKERLIAEKICYSVDYVETSLDQSLAGALVDKECVCNGYAMTFAYFCNAAGIDCISVVSYNHAWNRVKLYDNWYETDTTWMDQTEYDFLWEDWYNKSTSYFLSNDSENSHVIQSSCYSGMFILPSCTLNTVVVPSNKPTNVKATAGDGKVTLKWDAVSGATRYSVYYYIDGAYTNVSTAVKTTSYTVTGLTNGKQYGFLVRAYNGSEWSAFTSADRVYATPKSSVAAKPTNVKATAGDGKVTLTWSAVSGAKQYAVYYYIDGAYTNVSTAVKTTSYTVTGLTNGKEYGFLVRAYNGSAWSAFTSADRVYATPKSSVAAKPTNVKATAGDGKVTLTWSAVSGAKQYAVYYYIDGKYTNVSTTVKTTSYTVTGLTNGREYGFLVRAYNGSAWSAFTGTDRVYATPKSSVAAKPTNVKATAGDGKVTLTWSPVSGAKQYSVYYYIDGKYTNVSTTVKTTSYTVTGLTNGREYGFLVRAYNGSAWSAFTGTDRVYATPKAATSTKPTNIKATAGNGRVTLTWSPVSGAKQYSVYYYIDGKYTNVSTTVKTTSYTVTGLTNGREYGFLVRAYNGSEWSAFTSADRVYATPTA